MFLFHLYGNDYYYKPSYNKYTYTTFICSRIYNNYINIFSTNRIRTGVP